MSVQILNFNDATAFTNLYLRSKRLFRRNREFPLRYFLLASPVLFAVLVVGFVRYGYGRLMHQF